MLGGGADRRFGDLVEDHPLYRYARFEGFQQMPGNSFALTVPIRGQIQLVHVFEQALSSLTVLRFSGLMM